MRAPNKATQDINELRQRYDDLRTKKIQAEANLTNSNTNLEDLKRQAREKYGTDDLESLRAKLKGMRTDNDRILAEYDQHLTTIEQQLSQVETEHSKAANPEAKE